MSNEPNEPAKATVKADFEETASDIGLSSQGPHQGARVAKAGARLTRAEAAMIMVHGRGATAASILSLADEFEQPEVAYLAPEASGRSWYPKSFLAPIEDNEPGLSSGLQALGVVLRRIEAAGLPPERVILLGFSQGACLAAEFAARHARRYGGIALLSGALIGDGEDPEAEPPNNKTFEYNPGLDGTPVFLGCSDSDPHIPLERVHRSAEVFEALGGEVEEKIYSGMDHAVNEDEVHRIRRLIAAVVEDA